MSKYILAVANSGISMTFPQTSHADFPVLFVSGKVIFKDLSNILYNLQNYILIRKSSISLLPGLFLLVKVYERN